MSLSSTKPAENPSTGFLFSSAKSNKEKKTIWIRISEYQIESKWMLTATGCSTTIYHSSHHFVDSKSSDEQCHHIQAFYYRILSKQFFPDAKISGSNFMHKWKLHTATKFDWSIGNKATQSASIKLICLHFLETIRKMKWYAIVTHFFSHVKRIEYWFFRMTMSFFGMHKTIIRIATHEFWRISFHKVDGQLFNRSNRCISHNKMKHPNFNIFSICKRKKEQPESVSCQCGRF